MADQALRENKIVTWMKKNAVGAAGARIGRDIVQQLDICYGIKLNEREFRKLYQELSRTEMLGSHSSIGYFTIETWEDYKLNDAELTSRINALMYRREQTRKMCEAKLGKQMEFL
jgi:hypothetical protein